MLTPRFELSQDDEFLYISIYAPFTNLENTEIFMDGTDFRFFSKPYYLRLHLPGEVEESDKAGGEYDADTASFKVKCPKVKHGIHFQGLDMITQLLTPKGNNEVKTKIEDLSGDNNEENNGEADQESEEEEMDWYFEQTFPTDESNLIKSGEDVSLYGYGFNFAKTGVFKDLMDEFGQILDVKNPDVKTLSERRLERESLEDSDFSADHYLCDLYETSEIENILNCKTSWESLLSNQKSIDPKDPSLSFNKDEQEAMLALPRRTYSLREKERISVFLSLLDLLYGQCYDGRIREGDEDFGCETGWCAAKLSATLSACTKHKSIKDAVRTCIRRSLIYPLYRHWELSLLVWRDVINILKVGKVAVIKSLLKILKSFGETEGYHIFSQLYIQDYLVWVQTVPESHLQSLNDALQSVVKGITKSDVSLELDELEYAAILTIKEQQEEEESKLGIDAITNKINKVELDSDDDSDQESEDESEESDSSDDSSTEESSSSSESDDNDSENITNVKINESKSKITEVTDTNAEVINVANTTVQHGATVESAKKEETKVTIKEVISDAQLQS